MIRTVTLTIEIDPVKYDCDDTADSAIELIEKWLNDSGIYEDIVILCENSTKII